jgi:L-lactate dehydrogenase complex protein LldG
MSGRDTVLGRVRRALADVPKDESPAAVHVPRDYRRGNERPPHEVTDLFVDAVLDYGASVHRTTPGDLAPTVARICRARGIRTMAVAPGFPEQTVTAAGVVVLRDETPMSHASLDRADAVATSAALGIAETGTIVLVSGAGMGRRAISLVPDVHVCVIREDQLVETVPAAMEALATSATRPITFISGGSATSDIELVRVQGVHGPRVLEVVLLAADGGS